MASFTKNVQYIEPDGKINLLISDGITLTSDHMAYLEHSEAFVQRILTSYQFIRILREQYIEKAIVFIISRVSDEWEGVIAEAILESLRIKSLVQGSRIIFNIVGKAGMLKYYMKPAELAMLGEVQGSVKIWEDQQSPQGRL
ncbi:MAG: hypothetical protein ACYDAO_01035 [Thermoplasmataceae archaeon]